MKAENMRNELAGTLYEGALEQLVMNYMNNLNFEDIRSLIESETMDLLSQIMAALEDESLDDPECVQRIDAIIEAFGGKGVYISRHYW